ncbi:uncharacterized protein HMPREF1541_02080 [Cyphellophora europaea CBS 101466]|uniref:Uncharacterized protein n=1 Tax=Cyphellophora europaea (strain CBS 101466) TaxID=1220924 RepID=W2S2N3_CYPE1|nr:uncharacterized protein HMPREF1541_02080 [Cyphellophora europaea CBS 101466]ETN42922.1 hypothetical protein HMPREF1541_02080 [Cyphellophora europaea CBS 101466]
MDSDDSSQKSSEKSRRSLLGLRQLSSDAKGFFKEQVTKAKHVRDDLVHKRGEPSTPKRDVDPTQAQPLISSPITPSTPTTPWTSWKALPRQPKTDGKALPQQPTPSLSSPQPRLHHLSALRVGLTSLVVLHHTAIPYGGLGNWGWHSPCFPSMSPALAGFNAVNQTFFMAGFYWLAGYFTHGQLQKLIQRRAAPKSPSSSRREEGTSISFVTGRAQRLVVPAVAYTVLAAPLFRLLILASDRSLALSSSDVKQLLRNYFETLRGIKGPVWFSVVLFFFDAIAAGVATLRPSSFQQWPTWSSPQRKYVLGAFGLSALTAFLVRVPFPVGRILTPLNLQPAFLPQYIFAYAMGHICANTGSMYLHSLFLSSRNEPLSSLALSVVTMMLGLAATLASTMLSQKRIPSFTAGLKLTAGGLNLPAALYAIWNELGFITLLPSLVAVCEKYFNRADLLTFGLPRFSPFRKTPNKERRKVNLARYSYATFLVHPIVSLGVELLAQRFIMPHVDCSQLSKGKTAWALCAPVVATVVVGSVNTVASWMAGIAMVECVPFVGRWI